MECPLGAPQGTRHRGDSTRKHTINHNPSTDIEDHPLIGQQTFFLKVLNKFKKGLEVLTMDDE